MLERMLERDAPGLDDRHRAPAAVFALFLCPLAAPLGGLAVLAVAGLPRILRGRLVYAVAGLLVVSSWTVGCPLYLGRARNEIYGFARIAEFLRASARPGERVTPEPIGMIGYRGPLVVVDEAGLVSPAVARRRMRGPGR